MENLAKAIIAVMKDVKGIDKTMTVGTGAGSYKGVPDQEVKKIIGESMQKNGLTLLPIEIDPKTEVSRWEETTNYNGVPQTKQKQSVFTEVTTKYLLLHTSGESQIISGYGHGVDSQDKGAGKATTYALKYAMLYTFLVPTGKIDDSDKEHSDSIEAPKNTKPGNPELKQFDSLGKLTPAFNKAVIHVAQGGSIEQVEKTYTISKEVKDKIFDAAKTVTA